LWLFFPLFMCTAFRLLPTMKSVSWQQSPILQQSANGTYANQWPVLWFCKHFRPTKYAAKMLANLTLCKYSLFCPNNYDLFNENLQYMYVLKSCPNCKKQWSQ
jgi:hypothetical protein